MKNKLTIEKIWEIKKIINCSKFSFNLDCNTMTVEDDWLELEYWFRFENNVWEGYIKENDLVNDGHREIARKIVDILNKGDK